MRSLRVSPAAYRRVTFAATLALAFIIVSGAAVRLTGSGLGCPDWPTCSEGRVIAPLEYHALVEFVNRTITGAVSIAVVVAVLGSLVRSPRRADLVWLSAGLVVGVIGQIVLGGLVVMFDLAPPLVMGHFVISMALVLDAVVLHHRAGLPDRGRAVDLVPTDVRTLGLGLVALAAVVLATGTFVTGTGPHAGSHDGEFVERLPFAITTVARVHSVAVWAFLALAVYLATALRRERSSLFRRAEVVLVVAVAQGLIGYMQYFTGVPPLLVAVHIAGATAVWVSSLQLLLNMRDVEPSPSTPDLVSSLS